MSMSSFNEPWELTTAYYPGQNRAIYAAIRDGERVVADMRVVNGSFSPREAAVIAHAPAMHSTLELLFKQLMELGPEHQFHKDLPGWRHHLDDLLLDIQGTAADASDHAGADVQHE